MKLKPCLFCGNKDIRLGYNGALKYWYCSECNASSGETKDKLLPSIWNTRADDWKPIDINKPENLPDIDTYVLWIHENGYVFMECIGKDWDDKYLAYFLSGYGSKEISGKITHWREAPEWPEGTGVNPLPDKELDEKNSLYGTG